MGVKRIGVRRIRDKVGESTLRQIKFLLFQGSKITEKKTNMRQGETPNEQLTAMLIPNFV